MPKISDQIKISKENDLYSFSFTISGRAPTLVSGGQGDHVTAIALLEKGIARFLERVPFKEQSDLDKVRQIRDEEILDRYIARVLVIAPNKREKFIKTLEVIQDKYNALRVKKEDIRNSREALDALIEKRADIPEKIKSVQTLIEKAFTSNVEHMCTEIGRITKSFLTQYNKIPGVAFERVPTSPAPSEEGSDVKEALKYFDGVDARTIELKEITERLESDLTWLCSGEAQKYNKENRDKLKRLIAKERGGVPENTVIIGERNYPNLLETQQHDTKRKLNEMLGKLDHHCQDPKIIAENLSKLFFYPKVPDGYATQTKQMLQAGIDVSTRRDNDDDAFYRSMARHLHIAFAVYPHLLEKKEEITEEFVKINLTKWNMDIGMTKEVTANVVGVISRFEGDIESITKSEGYRSRSSSVDEGETMSEPGEGETGSVEEEVGDHRSPSPP